MCECYVFGGDSIYSIQCKISYSIANKFELVYWPYWPYRISLCLFHFWFHYYYFFLACAWMVYITQAICIEWCFWSLLKFVSAKKDFRNVKRLDGSPQYFLTTKFFSFYNFQIDWHFGVNVHRIQWRHT